MNIGLQPQYPVIWIVDIALAVIFVAFLVAGIVTNRSFQTKRVAKARRKFEDDHARWADQKRKAQEIERKEGWAAAPWVPSEPRFTLNYATSNAAMGLDVTAFSALAALVCTSLATIIMCVPFNPRYYAYYTETGTVEQVVPSLELGNDTSSATYTVALSGDDRRYGMDDPRIATLKGQPVTLLCGVGWNNQAADSWTCSLRDYPGSER